MAVFDDNVPDRPENFLEALVGEDKKFKTAEDLAKGKWESDNYINSVKAENEELKEKLATQARIEDLLKERIPTPERKEPEVNQPAQADAPLDQEGLRKLVREMNEEESRTKTVTQNLDEVANKLAELYGDEDKAAQVVRARAKELGVSVKFLESVAQQSPKAFFVQLGVETQSKPNGGPTHGEVNPAALGKSLGTSDRTYAWYQNIRRTDPKTYQTLQLQMHEDARSKGDDFYK